MGGEIHPQFFKIMKKTNKPLLQRSHYTSHETWLQKSSAYNWDHTAAL